MTITRMRKYTKNLQFYRLKIDLGYSFHTCFFTGCTLNIIIAFPIVFEESSTFSFYVDTYYKINHLLSFEFRHFFYNYNYDVSKFSNHNIIRCSNRNVYDLLARYICKQKYFIKNAKW